MILLLKSNFSLTLFSFFGNYLEPLAYLVYCVAVTIYARRQNSSRLSSLRWYYVLVFILMSLSSFLVGLDDLNTNWLYHIHAFITVWFLGLYFRNLFQDRYKQWVSLACIAVISLYLIIKVVVMQQYRYFDSIGFSLVSASVVLFVFMYFQQLFTNVKDSNILHDFNFWFSSGLLIYFLGNFIIFLTYHYFTLQILATYTKQERDLLTNLWGLHNCLLFAGALTLLGGSLWIVYRRKSASS